MRSIIPILFSFCILGAQASSYQMKPVIVLTNSKDKTGSDLLGSLKHLMDKKVRKFLIKEAGKTKKSVIYRINNQGNTQELINNLRLLLSVDPVLKSHLIEKQDIRAHSYLLTKEQNENLMKEISMENSVDSHSFFSSSDSKSLDSHIKMLESKASTLEFISLDSSSMSSLRDLLKQDFSMSAEYELDIIIDFENSQSVPRRKLEEEVEEERFEEKEPVRNLALAVVVLRASPDFLSGFLFGLFALTILLIGVCSLYQVKSPERFARFPLIIGRES